MQELKAKTTLLSALGDAEGEIYGKQDIEDALRRSLLAYSTYFPALRNMGQATLVEPCMTGATSLTIIGGFPAPGKAFTLGYGSTISETITIATVEFTPFSTYSITLTAPIVNSYYAGMLVSPQGNTQPSIGLQMVQGVDTYQLPLDFIEVEPESWSIAIGERPTYKAQDNYYDETQVIFNRLNSTGYGRSQGWSTFSGYGYPLYGNPFAQPSVSGLTPSDLVFQFLPGDIPFLSLNTPSPSNTLLTFQYYGIQIWPTISNDKAEIISLYAQYAALEARASVYLYGGDVEVEDYKEVNSNIGKILLAQANAALKKWNAYVQRPYITAG